jgi:hypothetical protein
MSETKLRGLLLGSSESPSCSKNMAASLSESVLGFLARSLANKEHPQIWSQVSVHFDTMLVGIWQQKPSEGHEQVAVHAHVAHATVNVLRHGDRSGSE